MQMTSQTPQATPQAFTGFADSMLERIWLPADFYSAVMPLVSDLHELKLLLFAFLILERSDGAFRYITKGDISSNEIMLAAFADTAALKRAFELAVQHGFLLAAEVQGDVLYFLNTSRGRAAILAIQEGKWQHVQRDAFHLRKVQHNIFQLYEENIGAITPMMADILKQDEAEYPAEWLVEALQIAVKSNRRTWRYVQGILTRWKKEGRNGQNEGLFAEDQRRNATRWLGQEGD